MENVIIVVAGLTCAGKGYLFQSLMKIGLRLTEIDMGDILRSRRRRDPDFAAKISEDQNSGALCSPEIVNGLADEKIKDFSKRPAIYLSGYPRNSAQLVHFLENPILNSHRICVVHIDTPKEVCLKRALAAQRGRDDDHADAVRKKFTDFETGTLPVIQKLKEIYPNFTFNGEHVDHHLVSLVKSLDLDDLIDFDQVSSEVKTQFGLWNFVSRSEEELIQADFLGEHSFSHKE